MINRDRDGTAFIDKYENEYNFNFKDGFTLKPSASKEAIKSLLLYKVKDKNILEYKDILANHLVNEFKKTDCYKSKNKSEREEIIQYLLDNPEEDEVHTNYTDENGNKIFI